MKLRYFRLNYYAQWERGFPCGRPCETHTFEVPENAVMPDKVQAFPGGADLDKAAQWARNIGYLGTFGIEEVGLFTEPK